MSLAEYTLRCPPWPPSCANGPFSSKRWRRKSLFCSVQCSLGSGQQTLGPRAPRWGICSRDSLVLFTPPPPHNTHKPLLPRAAPLERIKGQVTARTGCILEARDQSPVIAKVQPCPCQMCGFRKVFWPLWASVCPAIKWEGHKCMLFLCHGVELSEEGPPAGSGSVQEQVQLGEEHWASCREIILNPLSAQSSTRVGLRSLPGPLMLLSSLFCWWGNRGTARSATCQSSPQKSGSGFEPRTAHVTPV